MTGDLGSIMRQTFSAGGRATTGASPAASSVADAGPPVTDAAGTSDASFGSLLDTVWRTAARSRGAAPAPPSVQTGCMSAAAASTPAAAVTVAAASVSDAAPAIDVLAHLATGAPRKPAGADELAKPAAAAEAATVGTTLGALAQAVLVAGLAPRVAAPASAQNAAALPSGTPNAAAPASVSTPAATASPAASVVMPATTAAPVMRAGTASRPDGPGSPGSSVSPGAGTAVAGPYAPAARATETAAVTPAPSGPVLAGPAQAGISFTSPAPAPAGSAAALARVAPDPTPASKGAQDAAGDGSVGTAPQVGAAPAAISAIATSGSSPAPVTPIANPTPVTPSTATKPTPSRRPGIAESAPSGIATIAAASSGSGRHAGSAGPAHDGAPPGPDSVAAATALSQLASAGQLASASQQVAAAVSALASVPTFTGHGGSTDAAPGTAASGTATADVTPPGQMRTMADGTREIVVRLDPEHLGSVSIRLKMSGGKIDVAITVAETGTLDVLNRDRHLLTAAVSAAGLGTDSLVLLKADAPEVPTNQTVATGGAGAGSRQASDHGAPGSGDPAETGGRRREDRRHSPSSNDGGTNDGLAATTPARGGDLYV